MNEQACICPLCITREVYPSEGHTIDGKSVCVDCYEKELRHQHRRLMFVRGAEQALQDEIASFQPKPLTTNN